MKIELEADGMKDGKLIQFIGKTVEVKKELKTQYVFDYKGEEYKIRKKFAKVVEQ